LGILLIIIIIIIINLTSKTKKGAEDNLQRLCYNEFSIATGALFVNTKNIILAKYFFL